MKAINDTMQALLESIRERFGNPFVGSFLIAWCLVNFRIVLILIGGDTAQQKICFIERELINADDGLCKAIVWPMLCVCIYFLLIKPISAGFVFLHEYFETWYARSRNTALKMKLLTKEEQERLYVELHETVKASEEKHSKAKEIAAVYFKDREQITMTMGERMKSVMLKALPTLIEEWKEERVQIDLHAAWNGLGVARDIGYGIGLPESWLLFLQGLPGYLTANGYIGVIDIETAKAFFDKIGSKGDVQTMLEGLVAVDLLNLAWNGVNQGYEINEHNVREALEWYSRFLSASGRN